MHYFLFVWKRKKNLEGSYVIRYVEEKMIKRNLDWEKYECRKYIQKNIFPQINNEHVLTVSLVLALVWTYSRRQYLFLDSIL